MAFVGIKKGNYFYVKNTKTGKVGSNKFKEKKNADKQVANRIRFIKLMEKQKLKLSGATKKGQKDK